MDNLEEIRKRINSLDAQMTSLFEERMLQCRQVALFKREHGLSITDSAREAEVIAKNSILVKDDEIREYYARFQKGLMDTSKAYQSRIMEGIRVAYCGVPGAFAHIAAKQMFPEAELVPFSNFEDAYRSCENNLTDCAVLPIENSFAGDVAGVMDLMFSGSLYVNQVVEIAAVQNLLGCEGTTRESIKEVVSHPQAISQCAAFIRKNGYRVNEFPNTAMAARYVAEKKDPSIAAIASLESAELFGLNVIEPHINSSSTNTTRFAAFSRSRCSDKSKAKMGRHFILTFTVKNEAGALAKTLNIIGAHGFNMCSLKSRPMKELMWNYYFYMELDGDVQTEDGQDMLHALGSVCDRLKLVGSFTSQKNG